jgi:hypothetical protein
MKNLLPILTIFCLGTGMLRGEETPAPFASPEPDAPSDQDYAALQKTSPFTRVLSLPETYTLRGVASVGGAQIATLYNRETKKTIVVTPDGNNEAGLTLVEVVPGRDLEGVTAKISFAGDEAELKYDIEHIFPQPGQHGGGGGKHDGGKDGERRGPSSQDIERFKALPEEKQAKLREYIGHVMKNYPDMPREEKGNLIRGAMIRLTDGRDIEMPGTPPQGGGSPPGSSGAPQSRGDGDRSERR